jgi:hypothetical protein
MGGDGKVIANAATASKGFLKISTASAYFTWGKTLDAADLQWSDLATGDMVTVSMSYPI